MHAISSYRGNMQTHKQTNTRSHKPTHRQDRLQYTAPQLARSVIIDKRSQWLLFWQKMCIFACCLDGIALQIEQTERSLYILIFVGKSVVESAINEATDSILPQGMLANSSSTISLLVVYSYHLIRVGEFYCPTVP